MIDQPMTVGELKAFLAEHNVPDDAGIWMETPPDGSREGNGSVPVMQVNVEAGSRGYFIVNVMLPPT